jgi:hypothetical protein
MVSLWQLVTKNAQKNHRECTEKPQKRKESTQTIYIEIKKIENTSEIL